MNDVILIIHNNGTLDVLDRGTIIVMTFLIASVKFTSFLFTFSK